jgi:hypothetical protein
VAEIGLFVDRKETLVVHQSGDIRQRLLDQLKNVISNDVQDVTPNDDADSLLAEIAKGVDATPTVPAPPAEAEEYLGVTLHSIPHESPDKKSNESPESIPHDETPKGLTS